MLELLLYRAFAPQIGDDVVERVLAQMDAKRLHEEELWRGTEIMAMQSAGGAVRPFGCVAEPKQVGSLIVCANCGCAGGTLVNVDGDKAHKVHKRCP